VTKVHGKQLGRHCGEQVRLESWADDEIYENEDKTSWLDEIRAMAVKNVGSPTSAGRPITFPLPLLDEIGASGAVTNECAEWGAYH